MIKLASTWTNWFMTITFSVNWLLHHHTWPRHPGCGEQQIEATCDELVWDKVELERIDLLVTSDRVRAGQYRLLCPRSNIGFYMPNALNI